MKNLNNKTKKQLIGCIETLQKQIKELEKDKSESQNLVRKLQDRGEILNAIFNTAKDSIFIKDLSLRYVKVNPAMEELFGMGSEKLLSKTDIDLFGEEAGKHVIEMDKKVLGGEVVEEFPEKPVDGVLHIFHTIKVPLKDSNGKIVGLCGIARNITELKNAEKALRESEARWKTLSENSPALIILQDRDGKVLFVNRPVSDQSKKKVVGKSIYNFIPPGFHEIASDCFKKVWKTGKQCSYSTQLKTAEDKVRHFDVWVNPVFEEKELVAIVSSSIDVSEKKRAEEALRESEEKTRAILDISPDVIHLVDNNGIILSSNEGFPKMLGLEIDDVVGKCVFDYMPNKSMPKRKAVLDKVFRTGEPLQFEDKVASGVFESHVHPVFNPAGEVKAVAIYARDITERKKAEEELKKHRDHLEELVKERTEELDNINKELQEKNKELERFNKLFIKREFRIKELRDRVKELKGKAGEKR